MIKSPISFGGVYMLQHERPWSNIQRGLDDMQTRGFDLVTLWPASSRWLAEKAADFVFTDTLRVLDECHARGIKVLVQLIGRNQAYEFMPDTLILAAPLRQL